jgi:hypothetical protein
LVFLFSFEQHKERANKKTTISKAVTTNAIAPKAFKIGGNQAKIEFKQPSTGTPLNKFKIRF